MASVDGRRPRGPVWLPTRANKWRHSKQRERRRRRGWQRRLGRRHTRVARMIVLRMDPASLHSSRHPRDQGAAAVAVQMRAIRTCRTACQRRRHVRIRGAGSRSPSGGGTIRARRQLPLGHVRGTQALAALGASYQGHRRKRGDTLTLGNSCPQALEFRLEVHTMCLRYRIQQAVI